MSLVKEYKEKAKDDKPALSLMIRYHFEREILKYFSQKGVGKHLVFQGGTSIKLVYESPRYSVDIDFVRNPESDADLKKLCDGLDKYLKEKYPEFEFELKVQKDKPEIQRIFLKVSHPTFERKMKIPIEKFDVIAYTQHRYRDGEMNITVEDKEELLADKIVALMFRKFLKVGDVYDTYYLTERGVKPNIDLIKAKIEDYGENLTEDTVKKAMQKLENGKNELLVGVGKYFISPYKERVLDSVDLLIQRGVYVLNSVEKQLFPNMDMEEEVDDYELG